MDLNDDATKLWHMRFGHACEKSMQALAKQCLLNGAKTCKLGMGNKIKVKFDTTIYLIKEILDYVHINVWGLSKNASLRGKYYFVSVADDYSRRN